MLITSVNVN